MIRIKDITDLVLRVSVFTGTMLMGILAGQLLIYLVGNILYKLVV